MQMGRIKLIMVLKGAFKYFFVSSDFLHYKHTIYFIIIIKASFLIENNNKMKYNLESLCILILLNNRFI